MQILDMIFFVILICAQITLNNAKAPNVLLIIVDDLRPALGTYGDTGAHTPNIDNLARKSFVFTEAYAQQALCAPSRNSFLTSRRPDTLHLYDFNSYWRDEVGNFTTLPQYFKENGYYTHSIGKVFHPGITSNFSDDAKYSWSEKPFHPTTEIYKNAPVCVRDTGRLHKDLICPVVVDEQPGGTLPDIESLSAATDFLKYRKNITGNKPFFLAVGFHKPHIPFKYPIEYLKYHPLEKVIVPQNIQRPPLLPAVAWNPWNDVRTRDDIAALNVSFPFGPMPIEITKKIIQSYNAATTYIDDLVGQLLKQVDEDTVIVFTSDHGWSYGEHGEFSKYSNFREATHVPLIIHVPHLNRENKVIIKDPAELVDLFPTLVDLTQVARSLDSCTGNADNSKLCTEGKSLVPSMYFSSPDALNMVYQKSRAAFTQYPRPDIFPTLWPDSDKPKLKDIRIMGYSMITHRFRYTEWVRFDNRNCIPFWNNTVDTELYDRTIDPDENANLAYLPELEYVLRALQKRLHAGWRSNQYMYMY